MGSLPGIHRPTDKHPAAPGGLGMKKFFMRLSVAYRILFRRDKHWVYIHLDRENFKKLVKEEKDFSLEIDFHGMQKYNLLFMIKSISDEIGFTDMVEEKARFEANVDEWIKKV